MGASCSSWSACVCGSSGRSKTCHRLALSLSVGFFVCGSLMIVSSIAK
jgi:hypothetical protein